LKSLKTWDDDNAATPAMNAAMTEALGGEDAERKLRMQAADIVQSADNAVYAMNPKISRPGPEFANLDVAFWSPKTAETKTAAAKPGSTKTPAAKKEEP